MSGMIKRVFMLMLCYSLYGNIGYAQTFNPDRFRFASFTFETRQNQPVAYSDRSGRFYNNPYQASVLVPLFSGTIDRQENSPPRRWGILGGASLGISDLYISYFNRHRMLIDAGMVAGAYYTFGQGYQLVGFIRVQVNEDEYTINYPAERYTGLLLGTSGIGRPLQYHLGVGYTLLFGDANLLPVAGFTWKPATHFELRILFPYQAALRFAMSSKLAMLLSVAPAGTVNRFANKFNFPEEITRTLLLSQQRFVSDLQLYVQVKNNLFLVPSIGVVIAQQFEFSGDGPRVKTSGMLRSGSEIRTAGQLGLKLIWKPWQNNLRNRDKALPDDAYEGALSF